MNRQEFIERYNKETGKNIIGFRISFSNHEITGYSEEDYQIFKSSIVRAEKSLEDTILIPRSHLEHILKNLKKLTKLGRTNMSEFANQNAEVSKLKNEIFTLSEFASMYASQALRNG
jgi:hypothetical protein